MSAIFTNIRAKKIIAQNLVRIRKCRLPKNKSTFLPYFLNGTLVSKKAPFKKYMKKVAVIFLKEIIFLGGKRSTMFFLNLMMKKIAQL